MKYLIFLLFLKASVVTTGIVSVNKTAIYTAPSAGYVYIKLFTVRNAQVWIYQNGNVIDNGVQIGTVGNCGQDTAKFQEELIVSKGDSIYLQSSVANTVIYRIVQ